MSPSTNTTVSKVKVPHNKRAILLALIPLLLIIGLLGGLYLWQSSDSSGDATGSNSPVQSVSIEDLQSLDSATLDISDNEQLVVNGELKANGAFILNSNEQAPQTPQVGEIYFDEVNGFIRYYNGTEFVDLAANENICYVGAADGCGFTNGDSNAADDLVVSTQFDGDISGLFNNLQVNPNTIGSLEVRDGSVLNADLLNSAISVTTGDGLNGGGTVALGGTISIGLPTCSAGQVLEFSGSAWVCDADDFGVADFTISDGLNSNLVSNGDTLNFSTGNGIVPLITVPDQVGFNLGDLTADWSQSGAFDIVLNNAASELRILESLGDTFYGTIDIGNLSADRTYSFPDQDGVVCLTIGNCSGLANSLQDAYDGGNTIIATDGRDLSITLSDTAVDPSFVIDLVGSDTALEVEDNGTQVFAVNNDDDPYTTFSTDGPGTVVVSPTNDRSPGLVINALQTDSAGRPFQIRNADTNTQLLYVSNSGQLRANYGNEAGPGLAFQASGNGTGIYLEPPTATGFVGFSLNGNRVGSYEYDSASSPAEVTYSVGKPGALTGQLELFNSGSATNSAIISSALLGQSTSYNLIDPGQASVDICLSSGNCTGASIGGFIQGSVPFAAADGTLTENNSGLYWDAVSNSLSINTNSNPGYRLNVNGNGNISTDLRVGSQVQIGSPNNTYDECWSFLASFDCSAQVEVFNDTTDTTKPAYGQFSNLVLNHAVTNANSNIASYDGFVLGGSVDFTGVNSVSKSAVTNLSSGNIADLRVFDGQYAGSGSTDVDSLAVLNASYSASTGSVVDAYGLRVESGAGAAVTNNYGAYIANQTNAANNYGLYVEGASTYPLWVDSGLSRFDGQLELNSLATANSNTIVCRNASNLLAECSSSFVSTSNGFVQGGNDFSATGTLGLTGANDLNLITSNLTRQTIQADGDIAFDTDTLFVDATGDEVGIGTATPTGALQVVGDEVRIGDGGTIDLAVDDGDLYVEDQLEVDGDISIAGSLLPAVSGASDIGSVSLEVRDVFIGDDNGLVLGVDQDATLAFDEAGNDRVELSGAGASLFIEDRLGLGSSVELVADNGGGTSASTTLSAATSVVDINCQDADGCDITLGEGSASDGDLLIITNISVNLVNFSDTAGVSEIALAFGAGQWDTITLVYRSDRWVEVSRSDN